jgi:hypothetical protein
VDYAPDLVQGSFDLVVTGGVEMAEDGEHRLLARTEPTAGECARRAWAKPALHRFSLQRTMALSGHTTDTHKASSATGT